MIVGTGDWKGLRTCVVREDTFFPKLLERFFLILIYFVNFLFFFKVRPIRLLNIFLLKTLGRYPSMHLIFNDLSTLLSVFSFASREGNVYSKYHTWWNRSGLSIYGILFTTTCNWTSHLEEPTEGETRGEIPYSNFYASLISKSTLWLQRIGQATTGNYFCDGIRNQNLLVSIVVVFYTCKFLQLWFSICSCLHL